VLALAAQIPSTEIGTGYFQETQQTLTFQECSHSCELVTRTEQLPRVTQIAVQQALSMPPKITGEQVKGFALAKRRSPVRVRGRLGWPACSSASGCPEAEMEASTDAVASSPRDPLGCWPPPSSGAARLRRR
jgi:hypothetical protein